MADGGGRHDRASTSPLDGAFLLQLLQRPPQSRTSSAPLAPLAPPPTRPLPQEGLNPHRDPAVAAVGPSYSFPPHRFLHPQPPPPPPSAPSAPIPQGFPPGPWLQPPAFHTGAFPFFHGGDFNAPGNLPPGTRASAPAPTSGGIPRDLRLQQQQDGVSASNSWRNKSNSWSGGEDRGLVNARSGARKSPAGGAVGGMDGNSSSVSRGFVHEPKARAGRPQDRNQNSVERPGMMGRGRPPGPTYRVKASAERVATNARREESLNVVNRLENRASPEVRVVQGVSPGLQRSSADSHVKLQNGLSFGSSKLSARSSKDFVEGPHAQDNQDDSSEEEIDEIEVFEAEVEVRRGACGEEDALAEKMMDNLMVNGGISCKTVLKRVKTSRSKESRFDSHRGHRISGLRVRFRRRCMECRYGIERFTPYFMSIYQSLVPAEEEKVKQKQLLLFLEKLVNKQWPKAQLHVYGSCANSFGVTNSDIDVCLAIDDSELSKPEILLKLADILQSDNLQNVQALTHARVPIVKLMDPVTGISCDICINNLLAVVNTKLLRDYALIDERLQQLAFVVKHWAKSRRINETYRGTLSSYAYVLMCIHFLQQRQPAILPCLQQMETTYVITVDDMECAYFDRVERLHNFGAHNKESLAHLLWAFFHYWAYCHDYTNDVISVRTGRIMSKRAKDWTRRIGNDRHLICIEDPFEIHHDLGRVVDKHSIKILREEFERAADIMQFDPNPSITLFEPYVPPASPENQVLPELEV